MTESSGQSALDLGVPGGRPARGARRGQAGRSARGSRRVRRARPVADVDPIAAVAVDIALPHLDRTFDYQVPAALADTALPGRRVRVRFSGTLTDGFIVERRATTEHRGTLAPLERVLSTERVLDDDLLGVARAVARRYAGTLADVLRLAVPPRHARAEAEPAPDPPPPPPVPEPGPWSAYPTGPSFVAALARGGAPRAAWAALPGADHWPAALAVAVQAALSAGRGAVVVLPDARDVARLDAALAGTLGEGRHVALTAELGPAERYRRWLRASRGAVRAVIGTRAAMFAPVADLGLVALWDDGDDVHAERHAPYPHAREVLALRAHRAGAAALIGGFTVTAECAALVETGWARPLRPDRAALRRAAPLVRCAGEDAELARDAGARAARLPSLALRTARSALAGGPVLVQVPRRGYLPSLACARCRRPARCAACGGPLALPSGQQVPSCRWCGRLAGDHRCPHCEATGVRAHVVGALRTAEELGRAFPGVPVHRSGGDAVLAAVDAAPALVVATPGAEPVAAGGYAAALLLDGWALLGRADLRAAEEAIRRWFAAAALVRPRDAGGTVVLLADQALPAAQALVRFDSAAHAERELAERAELSFPPAVRLAALTGPPAALDELVDIARRCGLPAAAEILGPVPVQDPRPGTGEAAEPVPRRLLVRVPRSGAAALSDALRTALARRGPVPRERVVRVRVDPRDIA